VGSGTPTGPGRGSGAVSPGVDPSRDTLGAPREHHGPSTGAEGGWKARREQARKSAKKRDVTRNSLVPRCRESSRGPDGARDPGAKKREKARESARRRETARESASAPPGARKSADGREKARRRADATRGWRLPDRCTVEASGRPGLGMAVAPRAMLLHFAGSGAALPRFAGSRGAVGYCHIGQGSYQSGRRGWSSLGLQPDPRTARLVGSTSCIGGALLATPVPFARHACHAGHPRARFNHCVPSDRGKAGALSPKLNPPFVFPPFVHSRHMGRTRAHKALS
jgi:hypothetical protein